MADIVIDTNILADLLAQYYEDNVRDEGRFEDKGSLNKDLVRALNTILKWHLQANIEDESSSFPGLVVASSLAFVEIARQFDEIANRCFTVEQFAAFIDQPPEWFFISPVDSAIFPHLCNLPREIELPNGSIRSIEWADAIHIATAMSRGEGCLLAITDWTMKEVDVVRERII